MTIIAIVVPVAVVLLILMAIGGWCLYRINVYNKDKRGLEVVSVQRTRPFTPPKDEKKVMNEPAVQNNTDEEDIPASNDAGDLQAMKSLKDKPDVNI